MVIHVGEKAENKDYQETKRTKQGRKTTEARKGSQKFRQRVCRGSKIKDVSEGERAKKEVTKWLETLEHSKEEERRGVDRRNEGSGKQGSGKQRKGVEPLEK